MMRERACSIIEFFSEYKFTDKSLIEIITKKICSLLTDKDLPVRVAAALAAPGLLHIPLVKEFLTPHVPKLLMIYLNLMNDIDLEEILESLTAIISSFSILIKDYALELTEQLVKTFHRLLSSEEDTEFTGENLSVAEAVIRTIIKLIEIFINYDDIYPKIEILVYDIIMYGLKEVTSERFEDVLDVVYAIVKNSIKISPKIWNFYPEIIDSVIGSEEDYKDYKDSYPEEEYEGFGYESMSDIVTVVSYYITK
jgi:hypothetical protein